MIPDNFDISDIQVVVLMGGLGTRLGEIGKDLPKSMIMVHNKPFFEYQLNLFKIAGFRDFLFLVGYKSEVIEDYFSDGSKFGVSIQYSYDGPSQLGTAGAIRNAKDKLKQEFLLCYGDSFMDIDYSEVVYRFKKSNNKASMTIFHNNNQLDASNVYYDKAKNTIKYQKGIKDPSYQYIDYGISIFDKSIFEDPKFENVKDLSDIQSQLELTPCEVYKKFYEIGTPSSLNNFKDYIQKRFIESNKAVFLDRDGVINEMWLNESEHKADSPKDIKSFIFRPRIIEALKIISNKGYKIFIVTNQPGAAKNKIPLLGIYDISHYMESKLVESSIFIDDIQICLHHPTGTPEGEQFLIRECNCRKPKNGLLKNILEKYNIDIGQSYMIGDSKSDIQAGLSVGLNIIYINYKENHLLLKPEKINIDCFKADDLYDAIKFIK